MLATEHRQGNPASRKARPLSALPRQSISRQSSPTRQERPLPRLAGAQSTPELTHVASSFSSSSSCLGPMNTKQLQRSVHEHGVGRISRSSARERPLSAQATLGRAPSHASPSPHGAQPVGCAQPPSSRLVDTARTSSTSTPSSYWCGRLEITILRCEDIAVPSTALASVLSPFVRFRLHTGYMRSSLLPGATPSPTAQLTFYRTLHVNRGGSNTHFRDRHCCR